MMGKLPGIYLSVLLTASAYSVSENHFRVFTDTSGRTIEAKLIDYDADKGVIQLKLSNGKNGKIPLNQLCPEDRQFLQQWHVKQAFLDNRNFEVDIEEIASSWKSLDDGRKNKSTRFKINLTNHMPNDLVDVYAEYCLYRDRKDYIATDNYEVNMDTIKAGQTFSTKSPVGHVSYKRSSNGFLNEVVGARFRFSWIADDGSEVCREVCIPKKLPLEKYPWVEGKRAKEMVKANAKAPESYPHINMAQEDVRNLAESYIQCFEDENYKGWETLLSPMHPGHEDLNNNEFQYYVKEIRKMKIKDIEGLNVKIEVRWDSGTKEESWLQINPSGHIKYTPLEFQHPVIRSLKLLHLLDNDDYSWRNTGHLNLKEFGIPTFGYDANESGEQKDEIEKILDWIKENGRSYDSTKPELPATAEQFEDALESVEQRLF